MKHASHSRILQPLQLQIPKPTPVGTSWCINDGPTEKPSSFVDRLFQLKAQQQKSNLKGTTDFIHCIEKMKVPTASILVSMDVPSVFINIPQEGIHTVCIAYVTSNMNEPISVLLL